MNLNRPSYAFLSLFILCLLDLSLSEKFACNLSEDSNGNQQNILNHMNAHKMFGKRFQYENKSNIYKFVVCGDAATDKKYATIIRKINLQDNEVSLGSRNVTTLAGNVKSGVWLMMSFADGDLITKCGKTRLSSDVMILCDPVESSDTFQLLYHDDCHYVFELRTRSVCDHLPGMSGWTIFFIIVVVSLLVYFISGFLYLRFIIRAQGIEQIPHRIFWFGVGNKLADGCSACCRCDQFCGNGDGTADDHSPYSSSYSPIGEGSQQQPYRSQPDSQNDTALLNP